MRIFGRSMLPAVVNKGTKITPLLNADEIFQAEQEVIESTGLGEDFYVSHYSLPQVWEVPSTGTPASRSQRQMLELIHKKIRKDGARGFIVADNSRADSKEGAPVIRNEESIEWLHAAGAYVLSYPMHYVSINHTKFVANKDHVVLTSANLSSHSADSPDDNTGFLISGAAAHNGVVRSFLPQWRFSFTEDQRGWAGNYPNPEADPNPQFDETVFWLNTAPSEETGSYFDSVQIFDGYRKLIERAASGPPNAYLYFEHFDLSNLMLLRHLFYARHVNPTLDIRFILDPNQYLEGLKAGTHDARVVAYDEVKYSGIPLRFGRVKPHPNGSDEPQRFHDKLAIYNDAEVINGSGNLSNHSLNGNGMMPLADEDVSFGKKKLHNREVDVLVRDADCAKAFKAKFLDDWMYRSFDDPVIAAGQGMNGSPANTRDVIPSEARNLLSKADPSAAEAASG